MPGNNPRPRRWHLTRAPTSVMRDDISSVVPIPDDTIIRDFLSAVTGKVIGLEEVSTPEFQAYITFVCQSIESYGLQRLFTCLHGRTTNSRGSIDGSRIFELFTDLASFVKENDGFTIDEAIGHLVSVERLTGEVDDSLQQNRRHFVVAALGWLSGLYSTDPPTTELLFHLRFDDGNDGSSNLTEPITRCERPYAELLDSLLHSFMPNRLVQDSTPSSAHHNQPLITGIDSLSVTDFMVDQLNAAALVRVGGLSIKWTNSLRLHLSFDVVQKNIIFFREPTICRILAEPNSLLYRLQMSMYNEFDRPTDYTPTKMLREVELSYRLIFGENRKSRKLYQAQESTHASINGNKDPVLDSLCGLPQVELDDTAWLQQQPQTHSFDKMQLFPFLQRRLDEVQEYMLRQQPHGIFDMLVDRRDKFKWHTFWAVIIIGGVGLLLSVLQTILSLLQVILAFKSLSQ